MFNIAKASANARKDLDNKKVGAIILGPSGAGKSSLLGTFGCKTLFLYTGGEVHGPTAAATYGKGDVIGVRFDQDDEGTQLSADDSYARLLSILDAEGSLKEAGIGAIVIDSMTEVEFIIRSTSKFAKDCMTDKGKHNNFAEPQVTLNLFRPVLVKLRDLQLNIGIHYAVTCLLTVSAIGDNGEIEESAPKLSGYMVADGIIPQFPDVLVVGRMVGKSGIPARRIQFNAGVSKVSKDAVGTVKKMINFDPRITGVEKLPGNMEASLAKVVEMKQGEAK
jgi:hypothetical protein